MATYAPGDQVKVAGLDEDCFPTVELARFVRWVDDPETLICHDGSEMHVDCVIRTNAGNLMRTASSDFLGV